MSLPSIVSYGAAAKTSSLVWDGDLVIPDGYSIESASGEVEIVGDVSVSGSVSADGAISAGGNIAGNGITTSGKPLVVGKLISDADVTLTQITPNVSNYTSPDFPINNITENVLYSVPAIQYKVIGGDPGEVATFTLQAKQTSGSYTTIATVSFDLGSTADGYTQVAVLPIGATALRYLAKTGWVSNTGRIVSDLNLSLKPIAVY